MTSVAVPDASPPLIVLGSAALDRIYTDTAVVDLAGGAGLNVAVAARRLGIDSHLIANIGDDPAGSTLRQFLQGEGVTLCSTAAPGQPTTIVESRCESETLQYRFNTARPSGLLTLNDQHLRAIRRAAGVVLSAVRVTDPTALHRLIGALDAAQGPRLYDPNPRWRTAADLQTHRREVDQLAPHVDLLKLGADDIHLLYPEATPQYVAERFRNTGTRAVLITDGPRGCTLFAADCSLTVPTPGLPGAIVDPMGAGDSTVAAIAYHLLRHGWPSTNSMWRQALRTAMTAAGITCRRSGAATATPQLTELTSRSGTC